MAGLENLQRLETFRTETSPRSLHRCVGQRFKPVPAAYVSHSRNVHAALKAGVRSAQAPLPYPHVEPVACTPPGLRAAHKESGTYLRHSPELWPACRA